MRGGVAAPARVPVSRPRAATSHLAFVGTPVDDIGFTPGYALAAIGSMSVALL